MTGRHGDLVHHGASRPFRRCGCRRSEPAVRDNLDARNSVARGAGLDYHSSCPCLIRGLRSERLKSQKTRGSPYILTMRVRAMVFCRGQ